MYKADICGPCQTHFNELGTAFSSILNDVSFVKILISQCQYGFVLINISLFHVAIYIV